MGVKKYLIRFLAFSVSAKANKHGKKFVGFLRTEKNIVTAVNVQPLYLMFLVGLPENFWPEKKAIIGKYPRKS